MWAEYIKEREGKETWTRPHGFIVFLIDGAECYIDSLYVEPQMRLKNYGSELTNELVRYAQAKGCRVLTCRVDTTSLNATESLKAILGYGFKIFGLQGSHIVLEKEIADGKSSFKSCR